MRIILSAAAITSGLLAFSHLAHAQTTPAPQVKKPAAAAAKSRPKEYDDSILQRMDHGPFYSGSVHGKTVALKGVAIKLGQDGEAGVSFDTELMRLADGWTGGYLNIVGERTTGGHPVVAGTNLFSSPVLPGWSRDGVFVDPRPVPVENPKGRPAGPLPAKMAQYHGLYRHGNQVVLSYSVDTTEILEMPSLETGNGQARITRTFNLAKSSTPLVLLVCEEKGATGSLQNQLAVLKTGGAEAASCLAVGLSGAPAGARLEVTAEGRVLLHLPALAKGANFQVSLSRTSESELPGFAQALQKSSVPSLKSFTQGGPVLWGKPLAVAGKLGTGEGAYVVDTVTVPEENPFNSWIRCSGVDFFSDGRAAVCSLSGDVWIVSGLDDTLKNVTWQRFATGLYQPLGLRIIDNQVYVTGRDRITRLRDLNKDGEADFYENFNSDITITDHYHEFVLDLQTDSKGNFYMAKGGNLGQASLPHHGTIMKVSRDGGKMEVIATGLRAPNGMGMGPDNQITVSDNEGNWVPASRVNLVKPGGFYGHVFTSHTPMPPTSYDTPLFWLPHTYEVDNSSGGQMWVTSKKWGPMKGEMLHTSYGACQLFHVMQEEVDGVHQAAVFKLPLSFDSGIMRGRFHPKDGQLYVCGLNVWQSASRTGANERGILQRVRFTGKPLNMPKEFHVQNKAIAITFTEALDPASAGDLQNYGIEQWNYKWTSNYGSPEFSVLNPDQKGHDPVEIKSISLSQDRKTVVLTVPELKPVMQMKIKYNITTAQGAPLKQEIYNTINKVPGGESIVAR